MELRRNHQSKGFGFGIVKMVVIAIILLSLMLVAYNQMQTPPTNTTGGYELSTGITNSNATRYDDKSYSFLPSSNGEVVSHQYYTLSYIEKHEQAEWVAYEMTQQMLQVPNVKRADRFNRDTAVSTGSAGYYDYRGSGFTRGHLAPAGDMAFNTTAMEESFFMSNISPQLRVFNNGVWKELEEQVRDWVYNNDHLYIVTGPVLSDNLSKIKKEKVSIPKYYYKVLLSNNSKSKKGIAFLLPHEMSVAPLSSYAISIDSLEKLTGIDFFQQMDDDPAIERLESEFTINAWNFSDARFKLRVSRWNKE